MRTRDLQRKGHPMPSKVQAGSRVVSLRLRDNLLERLEYSLNGMNTDRPETSSHHHALRAALTGYVSLKNSTPAWRIRSGHDGPAASLTTPCETDEPWPPPHAGAMATRSASLRGSRARG